MPRTKVDMIWSAYRLPHLEVRSNDRSQLVSSKFAIHDQRGPCRIYNYDAAHPIRNQFALECFPQKPIAVHVLEVIAGLRKYEPLQPLGDVCSTLHRGRSNGGPEHPRQGGFSQAEYIEIARVYGLPFPTSRTTASIGEQGELTNHMAVQGFRLCR